MAAARHLLLTGLPGVGKTTVLRCLARSLRDRKVEGFLTEEIRGADGRRQGFRAITFAGEQWTISHVDFTGPERVGRYGVDLPAVDRLAEIIERAIRERVDVCLVDEIGKMECLSQRFLEAMRHLLDSGIPAVASVAARGGSLIAEVKLRRDAEMWQVTVANRDQLAEQAVRWLDARWV